MWEVLSVFMLLRFVKGQEEGAGRCDYPIITIKTQKSRNKAAFKIKRSKVFNSKLLKKVKDSIVIKSDERSDIQDCYFMLNH